MLNKTAIHIRGRGIWNSLGMCLMMKQVSKKVVLILGMSKLILLMARLICISISNEQRIPCFFPTFSPSFAVGLVDDSYSNLGDKVCQSSFNLHFSVD